MKTGVNKSDSTFLSHILIFDIEDLTEFITKTSICFENQTVLLERFTSPSTTIITNVEIQQCGPQPCSTMDGFQQVYSSLLQC